MDNNFEVPEDPQAWIGLITQMESLHTPKKVVWWIPHPSGSPKCKISQPVLQGNPRGFIW